MFEKKLPILACLLVNVSCQSKCTVEIECYLTHVITKSSVVSQLVICPAILGSTEWKESDVNCSHFEASQVNPHPLVSQHVLLTVNALCLFGEKI